MQWHVDLQACRHSECYWVNEGTREKHLLIRWTVFPFYSLSPALSRACFNTACQVKRCFHFCSLPSQTGSLSKPLSLPCVQILHAVLGLRHCRVPQSLLKLQLQSAKLAVKQLLKMGISGISEILLKIIVGLGNTTQLCPRSIAQC